MKVLWFSHFIPYPPRGGNRQRSFNLLRQVARQHEVGLIAFNLDCESEDRLHEYHGSFQEVCASVSFWELPIRWRSPRWWAGLALSPLSPTAYSCKCFWSRTLHNMLSAELSGNKWDLVHYDSIDLAYYTSAASGVPKVLNHHNCESAMAARRADGESNPLKRAYLAQQARNLAQVEVKVCPEFDVNTVVSESDAELLRSRAGNCEIAVIENGTDTEYFHPMPALEEANTIVFAGGLNWYPNVAGLRFFIKQIWPSLQNMVPGVRFIIAGREPSREVADLTTDKSSITLVRNPEDIRPWIARGTVFICPIYDGGGTRLKLLDAMAMGKAIVTTTIGCEGLGVTDREQMIIADTPVDFARVVTQLMRNENLRRSLACSGREFVEKKFGWNSIGARLCKLYVRAEAEQRMPPDLTCESPCS